jgi:predicted GIY-YIG superfamily endonuclease
LKGKRYFVYIMSSHTGVLYTGLTSDLMRRASAHRAGAMIRAQDGSLRGSR